MIIKSPTPDGGVHTVRYWGVSHVKEKTQARLFIDKEGNYKRAAHERALFKQNETIWNDDCELKRSPLEMYRSGYYITYAYLLGKARHVGVSNILHRAARMHDSALYHLWGFHHNPKPRFNLASAEQYLNSPPEIFPEVERLREKLITELKLEGTEIFQHNFDFSVYARIRQNSAK